LTDLDKVFEEQKLNPGNRSAQKLLASTLVEIVHGQSALKQVLESSDAFFKKPI